MEAQFCPASGKRLDLPSSERLTPPPEELICPSCKETYPLEARFCPHCAIPLPTQSSPGRYRRFTFPAVLLIVILLCCSAALAAGGFFWQQYQQDERGPVAAFFARLTPTATHTLDAGGGNIQNEPPITPTDTPITPTDTPIIPTDTPITPTDTPSTPTDTPSTPTDTPVTPTDTPITPTDTPIPPQTNPQDNAELILIPAGDFIMGSDASTDPYFWGAEGPSHLVSLDSYWIYKTEVTNRMYQVCKEAQACPLPMQVHAIMDNSYYGNAFYDDYPVIYVSYAHAASYCRWAGGRLPTEAEWEKAARGPDGRLFPWGNASPDNQSGNICDSRCAWGIKESSVNDGFPGPAPVGTFPEGASPYGVLDMAGNVWEWTFDWFQPAYYNVSPGENPRGPASGETRTIRGGGWNNPTGGVRVVVRASVAPDRSLNTLGFRCVVDIP